MSFIPNQSLQSLLNTYLERLAAEEELQPAEIREAVMAGTMTLLANPNHPNVEPLLVGQPSRVKVNANLGTSPFCNNPDRELSKLEIALAAGTDTVMDLSIAGDLDGIRRKVIANCRKPVGTVPIYSVAQRILDAGGDVASLNPEDLFREIEHQAEQGVDFMTVHCGVTRRAAAWAAEPGNRIMGIVSRGGSMLARWMRENGQENPLLEEYDRILDIASRYNVVLSLGDGLRPGAGADAGDIAQWEEVLELGRLAARARKRGVQVMIEGPGHVPLNEVEAQIRGIKGATGGAPLYVLGPLTTDVATGWDHIAGAIGGALAVRAGVDFLCYLTPAEHLTLPDKEDVRQGVMASRVAAQVGEVALGRPRALKREKVLSQARRDLDWQAMRTASLDPETLDLRRKEHSSEEACAMCGEFCAVKMLRPKESAELCSQKKKG